MSQTRHLKLMSIIAVLSILSGTAVPSSYGISPQLDLDKLLKLAPSLPEMAPLQGSVQKQQVQTEPLTLKIQIKTFKEAVIVEKDLVDWYGWYLSVRKYLAATGGLSRCPIGTPIKFYKQGQIEAISSNLSCQLSVRGRNFPLPANTQLDVLILPVRPGKLPPASLEEIHHHIDDVSLH